MQNRFGCLLTLEQHSIICYVNTKQTVFSLIYVVCKIFSVVVVNSTSAIMGRQKTFGTRHYNRCCDPLL